MMPINSKARYLYAIFIEGLSSSDNPEDLFKLLLLTKCLLFYVDLKMP